jgi:hypothetical protein
MCSILLILLIFVIIFDFAHDCAISFDIAEESTQRACPSQTRLVSTSHRSATFRCEDPQEGAQSAQLPPLQRSLFLTENQQSHGGYGRRISMALWHMPQIEQKDSHDMPKVPRPLEPRYKAPYRAKGSSSISVFCLQRHLGDLGSELEAVGQGSNLVKPETALGVKAKNQKPTPSEGQKQGIRYQRKRWERRWRFFCHCISIWSTCSFSPMAGTRDGNF